MSNNEPRFIRTMQGKCVVIEDKAEGVTYNFGDIELANGFFDSLVLDLNIDAMAELERQKNAVDRGCFFNPGRRGS